MGISSLAPSTASSGEDERSGLGDTDDTPATETGLDTRSDKHSVTDTPTPTPTSNHTNNDKQRPSKLGLPKKYFCKICNQGFTRKHNMISHELIHSTVKPHLCQVCQLKFRRIHDLKRHEKLHSGEKPHICERCNKKFTRNDALVRHQNLPNACTPNKDWRGESGAQNEGRPQLPFIKLHFTQQKESSSTPASGDFAVYTQMSGLPTPQGSLQAVFPSNPFLKFVPRNLNDPPHRLGPLVPLMTIQRESEINNSIDINPNQFLDMDKYNQILLYVKKVEGEVLAQRDRIRVLEETSAKNEAENHPHLTDKTSADSEDTTNNS